MSEVTEIAETEVIETALDEKGLLMQRARMMGIRFSNNIGVDALKAKITEKMNEESAPSVGESEEPMAPPQMLANAVPEPKPLTKMQRRQALINEATKLVRLRITNLDPKKKSLHGEILTVANKYIGTVRKFVPFGEVTESGYHVQNCIYEMMKARRFLNIRTIKAKDGQERVENSYVPEFALEVLPQLTPKELKQLALQQAAAAGNA